MKIGEMLVNSACYAVVAATALSAAIWAKLNFGSKEKIR